MASDLRTVPSGPNLDAAVRDRVRAWGVHPLDNPVWRALVGPQATVAERVGHAARYDPAVAPFAAVPDEPEVDAWDALRSLVGAGGIALLFRAAPVAPPGWEEAARFPCRQMVATAALAGAPDGRVHPLGTGDVGDMLDLVARTEPGPFLQRTIELGRYVGIRYDGGLVAMAGERMRLPGYAEISAVCTDAAHRGHGLAAAVMRAVADTIERRGDVPFLHVVTENAAAIRVYEQLGFATRRLIDVTAWRAPD